MSGIGAGEVIAALRRRAEQLERQQALAGSEEN